MADTTRTTAVDFAGEVRDEIRKVSWPDQEQLKESTGVIIVFVAIVAVLIFIIDFLVRVGLNVISSVFGG